jgi:pimeloyl-ACP methyl ester carboxylesterase
MVDIETHYVKTNGIKLHVLQAGAIDGPLVLLLHGFPEFSYAWRYQIPALADAGFRVWAPDQRGYNLSDKPKGIGSYTLDALSRDVVGLIDASGYDQVYVVGHDWGGFVAWYTAEKYPERIKKMVILNAPHRKIMRENLRTNPTQQVKSQYIFDFQTPWLPEVRMKLQNYKGLKKALEASSKPGTFSESDFKKYHEAWSRPKAYHSMINWYRAFMQKPLLDDNLSHKIEVPTLLIWGEADRYLGVEMAQPSIDLCDNGKLIVMKDTGHWIQYEKAEEINKLIKEFFTL